jgi:hypothetical protein
MTKEELITALEPFQDEAEVYYYDGDIRLYLVTKITSDSDGDIVLKGEAS